jgi:hypothetical protein
MQRKKEIEDGSCSRHRHADKYHANRRLLME